MRLFFNVLLHSQCLGCFLTLNRHSISTSIMNEYIEFTRKSLFGAFCETLRKTQMDFLANTMKNETRNVCFSFLRWLLHSNKSR